MAYLDKAALEKAGFTDVIPPRSNFLIINLAGMEGTGKTTWALTAPKPLLYQSTDFGAEGVIQRAEGQILRPNHGDYKFDIPYELRNWIDRQETDKERQVREGKLANFVHQSFYIPFLEDFKRGLDAGVKTVVWDYALDVWEYTRLSVYGRNATNRSDLQAEANSKYREMIRMANVAKVNLIMIDQLKNKWESYYDSNGNVKWRKNELEFEMQGFDKAPRMVDLNLWTKYTAPDTFELIVKKCRGKGEMVGSEWPAMPFTELMSVLVPEVEDWS